jgi:hypothetical protein
MGVSVGRGVRVGGRGEGEKRGGGEGEKRGGGEGEKRGGGEGEKRGRGEGGEGVAALQAVMKMLNKIGARNVDTNRVKWGECL